jgi:hypothetical protein
MNRVKVSEVQPYYLDLRGAAAFLAISPKTISNLLALGTFPVQPKRYRSKRLFKLSDLQEFARSLESDSSEPVNKRGRKRVCKADGQEQSRVAGLVERKNPAGGRGSGDEDASKEMSHNDTTS